MATRCNPGFPDRKAYPFPALLLLDLKMHGIAGFGVLRWLQGQPELRKKLIVVVISVTQSSEEIRCGLRTGGAFVMSKIQKQICRHWGWHYAGQHGFAGLITNRIVRAQWIRN